MKNIPFYLLPFLMLVIQTPRLNAQVWFDIGMHGSASTSIWSDFKLYEDSKIDVLPKIGWNLALKLGINFNETEALVMDVGYVNRNFQLEQKDLQNGNDMVRNMNFGYSGFRILPLYRHTNEGTYFEIGPEFGWIQKSYYTDEANGSIPDNALFKENNLRGAIGFGGYLLGNEKISLITGIRILYDFKDLRSEKARQEAFPYQNYEDQRESYFKAIDIQFCLELNISLGFLVKSTCGRRKLLITW